MSNQLGFKLSGEIRIFGADGYDNIHHDITHCHKCWPGPQVTVIVRDDDLPGYRFSCSACKSKWNQTDSYIDEYNEAIERINLRYPFTP